MSTSQSQLSWNEIYKDVLMAVKGCQKNNSKLISSKRLADYVLDYPGCYPNLSSTRKCTISRITTCMKKNQWKLWSSEKQGGKQKVFIIPDGIL